MQVPINVELPNNRIMKLNEAPNGDVEVQVTEYGNRYSLMFRHFNITFGSHQFAECFTIPKNRRCLIAGWLVGDSRSESAV